MSPSAIDYGVAAWQLYQAGKAVKEAWNMRKRSSRRRAVGPTSAQGMWINVAGEMSLTPGATSLEDLLTPGDWSGTVTEREATLHRCVISFVLLNTNGAGFPQGTNYALVVTGIDGTINGNDIDNPTEWPDFFAVYDDVLRVGRLEFAGEDSTGYVYLPVQYSQLPDPVVNFKTTRRMKANDRLQLAVGGCNRNTGGGEFYIVRYYARFFVKPR